MTLSKVRRAPIVAFAALASASAALADASPDDAAKGLAQGRTRCRRDDARLAGRHRVLLQHGRPHFHATVDETGNGRRKL